VGHVSQDTPPGLIGWPKLTLMGSTTQARGKGGGRTPDRLDPSIIVLTLLQAKETLIVVVLDLLDSKHLVLEALVVGSPRIGLGGER
jgi:hypothetical protein